MDMDYHPLAGDEELFDALQRRGVGPITAVRIATAHDETKNDDLSHISYDKRSRKDLYDRAKELGIAGRSSMNRAELIEALRTR